MLGGGSVFGKNSKDTREGRGFTFLGGVEIFFKGLIFFFLGGGVVIGVKITDQGVWPENANEGLKEGKKHAKNINHGQIR